MAEVTEAALTGMSIQPATGVAEPLASSVAGWLPVAVLV
jgi:hypothetical protein